MTSGITVRPTLENPFPILRKKDDELVSTSILPFFFPSLANANFFSLTFPIVIYMVSLMLYFACYLLYILLEGQS